MTFGLFLLAGCDRTSKEDDTRPPIARIHDNSTVQASGPKDTALQITNRFGMTFCLVTVDSANPSHQDSFPVLVANDAVSIPIFLSRLTNRLHNGMLFLLS